MTRYLVAPIVALALAAVAPPAVAQSSLSTEINQLFTFGTCGLPLCFDVSGEHGGHFVPSLQSGGAAVISFLGAAIGRSAANTPLSATSSGATFSIVGGLPVRTSTSAGPIFGERAQTLGRGRFFLGANITGLAFTSLNGVPTNNIVINFVHQDVGEPGLGDPFYENDNVQVLLSMDVRLTVASVFATLGVTDFLDIGIAAPFVRTSINGASEIQVNPFGSTALHNFGFIDDTIPILRAASALQASATGIGDVVGRIKINLGQSTRFGAAILGDVRFPTGDETNLLGSGATAVRGLAVTSMQFGDFAPHLNLGYQARTGATQNDAVLTTIGFDNRMTDWATVAADLVGEWQVGASKVTLPGDVTYTIPFTRVLQQVNVPNRVENLLNVSLGTKFTMRGGTVLVMNAIFPIRKVGLAPDIVWTGGIEGAF